MFSAIDLIENKRVSIDYIIENSKTKDETIDFKYTHKFICPICKQELIAKSGNITPHFAHKPKAMQNCDEWQKNKGMTPWHKNFQDYFAKEDGIEREKIIVENGITHIADIFVYQTNTVLEFQHSAMSYKDFETRTNFYSKGHDLAWVIDWSEKDIELTKDSHHSYKYYTDAKKIGRNHMKLFDYVNSPLFRITHKKVRIFFDGGNNTLFEIIKRKDSDKNQVCLREHERNYFKHIIVLNKPYNGYLSYLEYEKEEAAC